jgi:hypothetical protein
MPDDYNNNQKIYDLLADWLYAYEQALGENEYLVKSIEDRFGDLAYDTGKFFLEEVDEHG